MKNDEEQDVIGLLAMLGARGRSRANFLFYAQYRTFYQNLYRYFIGKCPDRMRSRLCNLLPSILKNGGDPEARRIVNRYCENLDREDRYILYGMIWAGSARKLDPPALSMLKDLAASPEPDRNPGYDPKAVIHILWGVALSDA